MKAFKKRWEIQKNWQLIFPLLGVLGLLFSGYKLFTALFGKYIPLQENKILYYSIIGFGTLIFYYILLKITLWLFKKLENRWKTDYRWEMIAIFIVFAATGSSAARLSGPFLEWIGLSAEKMNGGLFWTLRILLIFPVYQVLLVAFGWLFGQYQFFWEFEKKMLKRMGFKRFFKD